MKKFNLLKFAIAVFLLGQGASAQAQLINLVEPTFLINSPSSVAGVKTMVVANDGSGTGDWGRAIDSFWYNLPIAMPSNDTLGCSQPPAGSLSGKIALISRGNCMFSEKAYNAQLAGAVAVVIYNNVSGGPVGMAAGTNAQLVTIPVLMISQADGLAIKSRLENSQPVNGSLTNWGFGFTHDLAIVNNSMALFHNLAIPKYELNGDTAHAYRSFLGALVANVGAATESNLKLKSTVSFTPTSGAPSVLLQDSVTASTFTTNDSVIEMLSPRAQVLPAISSKGQLTWNYSLTAAVADNQTGNNANSFSVDVTDSIYSKGRINTAGEPVASISYRFNNGAVDLWGPMYYINMPNHYAAKAQFTVSNGDNNTSLSGSSVTVYLFKWTDANGNKIVDATELDMKGAGVKNFTTADSNFNIFTVQFQALPNPSVPLVLDAKSYYWVAAEVDGSLYLGCDGNSNYFMRAYTGRNGGQHIVDYWAPQFQGNSNDLLNATTNIIQFPFQSVDSTDINSISFVASKGLVPAITMHSSNVPTAVKNVVANDASIKVYPNPATNVLNVQIASKNALSEVGYSVIDGIGRVVSKGVKSLVDKGFSLDVNGYAPGNYFLVIRNGETIYSNTFSVVK